MNDFNLNDLNEIEEVESRPERRIKNNNHRNRNRNKVKISFPKKFGFKEKLLMSKYLISLFIIFFTILINIILSIKRILLPKIFMPSILLFILTFLFAGGILGTYVVAFPGQNNILRRNELLMMRNFSPIIMLIISIIFGVFSLNNIKSMKKNIKQAQNLCETNKGLSMEEIYIKLNKTSNDLLQTYDNLIYTFNNNLVCFPKGKCIKLAENDHYLCNTDKFLINNTLLDTKCNKIDYYDNKIEFFENQSNIAKLFFENCKEINENNLENIELFDCQSKDNLEEKKLISGWEENNKIKIEKFFNNKLEKYNSQIQTIEKMITNYDKSEFNYDLECYSSLDYKLTYFLIDAYCLVYYFISISWIFFGFNGIYEIFKLVINDELGNKNNSEESRNVINLNNEEDNDLIIN